MYNPVRLKMCYEILNIPVKELAAQVGLTEGMVEQMKKEGKWTRWFPQEDEEFFLVKEEDLEEGEDILTVKISRYTENTQQKLRVFHLAKELALADMCFEIEYDILDKTKTAIQDLEITNVGDLRNLSAIYNSMVNKLQSATNVTLGKDENGLPTVIIKDLSGPQQ